MRAVLAFLAVIFMLGAPVAGQTQLWQSQSVQTQPAQTLSAIARLDASASSLSDKGRGVVLRLAISQPVPWRVRVLDNPPRLILDTREVDFSQIIDMTRDADRVADLRAGVFRPGWSRLVLELTGPYGVAGAGMTTENGATMIDVTLAPIDAAEFALLAAKPEPEAWVPPKPADLPKITPRGVGPLVVVLDPGHGGLDPGAERDGLREADLMLTFAREFKEVLQRSGNALVILTRDDDVFVPLEARISIARAAGAHVLLSLHADALAEGDASGATLYTLSDEASDAATRTLAERHDRDDLLAGVDLTEQDDLIANVLMDMARTENAPRVDRLAEALKTSIKAEGLRMHRRPIQSGGFSVLKSPDIPSLLIELGFLSSARDLARLTDPAWRARMAGALQTGLAQWADTEAALAGVGGAGVPKP
ncbi:N-acetylmuramoyl-L-alanine amidase [Pseudorhodobacter antarcticus]|uniref:N-acetylmuramoyl-L-alanine amidase n=1 Tax=Pseudorhodobacter antarcticus TaxID=1077947 RepID=A0A1H8BTN0_9RHOB|nr:N-acetylmuramoyl-L-alanine amidase [Pseudorhodobacter antarcticus]SEM85378.1 N-acetylmuramoyl-L-alanine amidase [Pseudorhodobacter antarcticus]